MTGFLPAYRPRPSPLHAARAGATSALCAALLLAAVLFEGPLVPAGVVAASALVGRAAGVGREIGRAAVLAVPLAVLIVAINAIVSRQGETVLVRAGEVLGRRLDITLEAVVYGGISGLRLLALVLPLALFTATVDPDDALRLFRRVSYRSALTASLATRLVPVLARDAARMGDAARCRPEPPPRGAAARAALRGALDRSVDVAAALELRGYSSASRPRRSRAPWSRHDLRVAAAAAAVALTAVAARVAGASGFDPFDPYPDMALAAGPAEAVLVAAVVLVPLLPFAGAGARLGVARA